MTNLQLYLAAGVPSFVALVGILVNIALYMHLSTRMETRLLSLEGRFDRLDTRMETVITRMEGRRHR